MKFFHFKFSIPSTSIANMKRERLIKFSRKKNSRKNLFLPHPNKNTVNYPYIIIFPLIHIFSLKFFRRIHLFPRIQSFLFSPRFHLIPSSFSTYSHFLFQGFSKERTVLSFFYMLNEEKKIFFKFFLQVS